MLLTPPSNVITERGIGRKLRLTELVPEMGGYATHPLEAGSAYLLEQGFEADVDPGVIVLARPAGTLPTAAGSGFGWGAEPLGEPDQLIPQHVDGSILGGFAAILEHAIAIRDSRARDNMKRDGGFVLGNIQFTDPAVIDGKGIGITEPLFPFVRLDSDFPFRLEAIGKTHCVQAAQSEIIEEAFSATAMPPQKSKNLRQVESVLGGDIYRRSLRHIAVVPDRCLE